MKPILFSTEMVRAIKPVGVGDLVRANNPRRSGKERIMREILFRGKRADNGEWVYGYYVVQNGSHQIYFDVPGSEWNIWNVDPATVGQYIGETDKNGARIFEGDRVLTDEAGWIGYVTFYGGEFYVTDEHGGYARCCNWSDYEVLGNIHDAPDKKGESNV